MRTSETEPIQPASAILAEGPDHTTTALSKPEAVHLGRRVWVDQSNDSVSGVLGSEDRPFVRVADAAAQAEPGDEIVVCPGRYRETIAFTTSGTADRPITLRAQRPGTVTVTGCDVVEGWTRSEIANNAWERADYRSPLPPPAANDFDYGELASIREMVFIDGQPLKPVLHAGDLKGGTFWLDRDGGRLVIVPQPMGGELGRGSLDASTGSITGGKSTQFDRSSDDGRWPVLMAPFDPARHRIEVTTRADLLRAGYRDPGPSVDHIHVRGITFHGAGARPQRAGVTLCGDHHRVEDCTFEYAAAGGFDLRGSHTEVRRCVFQFNGQNGLVGGRGEDCLFEDCRMAYNNWKHSTFVCFECGGCKIVFATRWTFRNCTAVGNDGPGIWFDIDNYDCVIDRCRAEGNAGAGIMYEISFGGQITNNLCRDNGQLYPVNGWFDTDRPAMKSVDQTYGQGILVQMSQGCRVLHNTCISNRAGGIELRHHPYQQGGDHSDIERYRLRDNIVMNNALIANQASNLVLTIPPLLASKADEIGDNRIDFNLYHNPQSLTELGNDGWAYSRWGKTQFGSTRSLEEWRVYSGQDRHSVQADPLFRGWREGDLRPSPGSPLIGHGSSAHTVEHDHRGERRSVQGGVTIGAFEL
ncbi:MAG: right-handed parallel beta-helix repeat-containing protein [Planctomycetota bacterium]